MNANHDLERRIADHYASEAPPRAPDWVLGSALATIETTPQRRAPILAPWRIPQMNTFAKLVAAAVAVVAVGAIGLAALQRPGPAPNVGVDATPSASPAAAATPEFEALPLTERFTSPTHGISISYPTGWTIHPASGSWTTGLPSEAGDRIEQRQTDSAFIAVASQPLAGKSGEAWAAEISAHRDWQDTCEPTVEQVTIDGAPGTIVVHCELSEETGAELPGVMTALASLEGRGYLIVLYRVDNLDWFREILASVQFHPEDAVASAAGFRQPFTYVLPTAAEFDAGPDYGPTYFEVRIPAAADAGTPSGLIVQAIGGGRTDPCAESGDVVPIESGPGAVMDYLVTIPALQVSERASTTVGGLPAEQATVLAAGAPGCPQIWPWAESPEPIPGGAPLRLIAVEVGGEHLVLTVFGEAANPAWDAMADELIGSIQFDSGAPSPAP